MANEKTLIYADDARRAILETEPKLAYCIDRIKPVDAVEVVHGHMVERIVDHECPWYTVYDCSECGCTVERWHSYCPNCGAKMDGDGNG